MTGDPPCYDVAFTHALMDENVRLRLELDHVRAKLDTAIDELACMCVEAEVPEGCVCDGCNFARSRDE